MAEAQIKTVSEFRNLVEKEDVLGLRRFSSKTIRTAVSGNEEFFVSLSILSHTISKIFSGDHYRRKKEIFQKFKEKLIDIIRQSESCFSEGKEDEGAKKLGELFSVIIEYDKKFGRFVEKMLYKARVKKASTLYALGISIGKSAELTNASEQDILRLAGGTKMVDEEGESKSAVKRLEHARDAL